LDSRAVRYRRVKLLLTPDGDAVQPRFRFKLLRRGVFFPWRHSSLVAVVIVIVIARIRTRSTSILDGRHAVEAKSNVLFSEDFELTVGVEERLNLCYLGRLAEK
jgi:hypothetical protein